jgi:hypothetical protein
LAELAELAEHAAQQWFERRQHGMRADTDLRRLERQYLLARIGRNIRVSRQAC